MEYINPSGFIISKFKHDIDFEYALLKNTNRWHKVYWGFTSWVDVAPYIKINNKRYYLDEFIATNFNNGGTNE